MLVPGGLLFAAAISRFASALDGLAQDLFADPEFHPIVQRDLADGIHENRTGRWLRTGEQGFTGDFKEYFAPGYRGHLSGQRPQSLDDLIRLERAFAAAFSNISYNVEDLLGVGDKVVLRSTTRAAHTGAFHGVEPAGRRVTVTGIVIYRFFDGRIVESWGELDLLGLFRQLRFP